MARIIVTGNKGYETVHLMGLALTVVEAKNLMEDLREAIFEACGVRY